MKLTKAEVHYINEYYIRKGYRVKWNKEYDKFYVRAMMTGKEYVFRHTGEPVRVLLEKADLFLNEQNGKD